MVIDVSRIEESVLPFSFEAQPGELDLDVANYRVIGPVNVSGEIVRHIGSVAVRGSIRGTAEADCTRCLQPVQSPLGIEFDVDYVTEGDIAASVETELQPGDMDTDQLEGYQLDLNQLAREQILLNIPEQIFCREDCKGLCEKCGANLNLVDCNCGEDKVDPRWAALKNLKDNMT